MPHEFRTTRRVEFADTDMAGVVHFASFFRYMEEAEHAFYRSVGGAAYEWREEGDVGMPRVSASCEYRRPLRYGESVEVHLVVRDMTPKSIAYDVAFHRVTPGRAERGRDAELVAHGAMTVVCATRPHGALEWRASELPRRLRDCILIAPGPG